MCKRQLRACCAGESLLEWRQSAASLTETEDDGISDKFKDVSSKRHSRQKMRPHLSTSISLACPPASPLARGVSPSWLLSCFTFFTSSFTGLSSGFLCNTQQESNEAHQYSYTSSMQVKKNKKNLTFFLTRWEMSETGAVEVLPLEVDVLLICLED